MAIHHARAVCVEELYPHPHRVKIPFWPLSEVPVHMVSIIGETTLSPYANTPPIIQDYVHLQYRVT